MASDIVVLVYDSSWGLDLLQVHRPVPGCVIITDFERLEEAHVVVFHIPTSPDLENVSKYPGQLWVALCMESEVNYPQLINPYIMQRFDLTMTYRLHSDLPVPYLSPQLPHDLGLRCVPKTEAAPVVYFCSNPSDRCGRAAFVQELMKSLSVDSYGRCSNNRVIPLDGGRHTKLETIARYRFTLALENSIATDYVTEKFFDPLIAGSVPIYRGAPNIERFAPAEHCYIDASQFSGAADLAKYITQLMDAEREYQSFLDWKTKPLKQEFIDLVKRFSGAALPRLSAKLSLKEGKLQSEHVQRDPIHQVVKWLDRRGGAPGPPKPLATR